MRETIDVAELESRLADADLTVLNLYPDRATAHQGNRQSTYQNLTWSAR